MRLKWCCALSAMLLLSGAAGAEILSTVDVNGDGSYSYTEMVAAYEGFTADQFGKVDTSGDGLVSAEELQAAITSGLLPH